MSTLPNSTTVTDPLAGFPHIPVANTLGAWLLGTATTLLLNGILFHQTYHYLHEYPSDHRFYKVWVMVVVALETFISALILHIAYFYLIQTYWFPAYFFIEPCVWSLNVLPVPATLAALLSQTFFVRRVWMFAPKFRIVVGIAFILNVGNVVFFTVFSAKLFTAVNLSAGLKYSWLASVGSSIQMTGDIILSLTLIYVLRQSRTGYNRSNSMIEVLMAYTISTGGLTCVVHILNVAFSIAWPSNFIYATLSCILTKLYANTFLVALNMRKFLHNNAAMNEMMDLRTFSTVPRVQNGCTCPNTSASHATLPSNAIELKIVSEATAEDTSCVCFKAEHKPSMV